MHLVGLYKRREHTRGTECVEVSLRGIFIVYHHIEQHRRTFSHIPSEIGAEEAEVQWFDVEANCKS